MVYGRNDVASAGVAAAWLLVEACGEEDGLQAAIARDLAEDLGRRLSSLSGAPDSLVEAALLCADLATLASCNAGILPGRSAASAATQLAAGATRALVTLAEAGMRGPRDAHAENALRDLRSAGWKADLAVEQLGEAG